MPDLLLIVDSDIFILLSAAGLLDRVAELLVRPRKTFAAYQPFPINWNEGVHSKGTTATDEAECLRYIVSYFNDLVSKVGPGFFVWFVKSVDGEKGIGFGAPTVEDLPVIT